MSAMLTEPMAMTVAEVARTLRISRRHAYNAIATGEIPSIRIGKRIVVPRERVIAMLEGEREAE
jgi:excisionase family DNA binding protein